MKKSLIGFLAMFAVLLMSMGMTAQTYPEKLYVIGASGGWAENTGLEMTTESDGVYTAKVTFTAANINMGIVSVLGSWSTMNANRWGFATNDAVITLGKTNTIVKGTGAIKFPEAGSYNITVDLTAMTILATKVAEATGSGIYLRGGVNSWGTDSAWEFQTTETANVYILENKTLTGEFKIASSDWSTYNYGSNGSVPVLGTPYTLSKGSNSNINLGSTSLVCKKITLNMTNSNAVTLLLEGDEGGGDTEDCVYVIGNNNNWNFNDASGKLEATDTDGEYQGTVTMVASGDGFCYWRIFEGLGQVGSWGFESNSKTNTRQGTFIKGKDGCATTLPNEYLVTFNKNTGEFTLGATSSVSRLNADGVKVVGGKGEISVSGDARSVAVYTFAGQLVARSSAKTIALPAGAYIVKVDGKVAKVIVK